MQSTVNVVGNTIADNAPNSEAIYVFTPPATATLKVNIFDNVLSGNGNGVSFPALNAKLSIS